MVTYKQSVILHLYTEVIRRLAWPYNTTHVFPISSYGGEAVRGRADAHISTSGGPHLILVG